MWTIYGAQKRSCGALILCDGVLCFGRSVDNASLISECFFDKFTKIMFQSDLWCKWKPLVFNKIDWELRDKGNI